MLSVPKQELNGQFAMLPMDEVHFGSGSVAKLGAALEQYNVERAVIITGRSLAQQTDLVARVESAAGGRTAGVFLETIAHVPRESVIAAAEFARSKQADAIISFGGGTPNDTAKAVAICLAEGIAQPDGLDAVRIKFEYPDKIDIPALSSDPLPMFAVPKIPARCPPPFRLASSPFSSASPIARAKSKTSISTSASPPKAYFSTPS